MDRWGGLRPLMGVRGQWAEHSAIVFAALGLLFVLATMAVFSRTHGWSYDLEAYFYAAKRLAAEQSIYQPWTIERPFQPGPWALYLYAPPLAWLMLPLTWISLPQAAVVWLVGRVGLLVVACALMPVSRQIRLWVFGVTCFSAPLLTDLDLGNVSTVVMCLTALVWRWLDRPWGSMALAVAMTMRPTLGALLFVWWALRRRWTPIVWTVFTGLVIGAVSLPFVGLDNYLDYLQVIRNLSGMTGVPNNLDLGSTVLRLGLGETVASIALWSGYAIAVGAMIVSLRRDVETSFIVTLGASLLLAPLLWDHYLLMLTITAAFLASRGRPLALGLPLVGWLPQPFLPLVVIAATLLPLFLPKDTARDAVSGDQADPSDVGRALAPAGP